jgi:subtilisin-like proprotein convertase family protein
MNSMHKNRLNPVAPERSLWTPGPVELFEIEGGLWSRLDTARLLMAAIVALLLFPAPPAAAEPLQAAPGGTHTSLPSAYYLADFEGAVGPEWSIQRVATAPRGQRFLGQLSNETVNLMFATLPATSMVRLTFDLYIIQSWDGSASGHGPDLMDVRVVGGPILLHTTFSNTGGNQSFPGSYPDASNPAFTGLSQYNALGYGDYRDSTYRLTYTFPRPAGMLKIAFKADTQIPNDSNAAISERWGLDNVSIALDDTGGPIPIPDVGSAAPYPSTIEVPPVVDACGQEVTLIDKVGVTLHGLTHDRPEDLDILLLGPTGLSVLLLSDVGGGPVADRTLAFDADAAGTVPSPIVSGTYLPTNAPGGTVDIFPQVVSPPATGYGGDLSVFRGTNPKGTWKLYILDDEAGGAGTLASGWSLDLLFAPALSNPREVTINSKGNATPFPSSIPVSLRNAACQPTLVGKVTVTLDGFSHVKPKEVDILLLGPTGLSVLLMSDIGGKAVTDATLTFDQAAAAAVPKRVVSGTYLPTNVGPGVDKFKPLSKPPGAYSVDLSIFNGTDPNGTWELYIQDDTTGNTGALLRGWRLTIAPAAAASDPDAVTEPRRRRAGT